MEAAMPRCKRRQGFFASKAKSAGVMAPMSHAVAT
jgi:hypothetical protein